MGILQGNQQKRVGYYGVSETLCHIKVKMIGIIPNPSIFTASNIPK
jgi:hypothetical protein